MKLGDFALISADVVVLGAPIAQTDIKHVKKVRSLTCGRRKSWSKNTNLGSVIYDILEANRERATVELLLQQQQLLHKASYVGMRRMCL